MVDDFTDMIANEATCELYVTGEGEVLLWVHEARPDCYIHGCVIHNPTDPRTSWPTAWFEGAMHRVCPCGVLHPDLNQVNYTIRMQGFREAVRFHQHECCEHCCCGGVDVLAKP
jgi:hypothetical protein